MEFSKGEGLEEKMVRVKGDTWRTLMVLKLDLGLRSLDEVIRTLIIAVNREELKRRRGI